MASQGSGGRNRGHTFERKVVKYIGKHIKVPVSTTRNRVRGAGADIASQTPEGLWVPWIHMPQTKFPAPRKWSIECKSTERWEPEKWMEQAERQRNDECPGGSYAVFADRKHKKMETTWVILPDHRGGPHPYRYMQLDQFLAREM